MTISYKSLTMADHKIINKYNAANINVPDTMLDWMRSNHAGETGAVFIYKAILMVSRDREVIDFSKNHLKTESDHLIMIEEIL